jgi:hypothetical protein
MQYYEIGSQFVARRMSIVGAVEAKETHVKKETGESGAWDSPAVARLWRHKEV